MSGVLPTMKVFAVWRMKIIILHQGMIAEMPVSVRVTLMVIRIAMDLTQLPSSWISVEAHFLLPVPMGIPARVILTVMWM
jgi:hypothetical protein